MNTLLNNKLIAFLKLVRIENLIMIALTQFLLRYFVIQKSLNQNNIELSLHPSLFYLIILSTILIAAAGYIINDYFDVKTDTINHPLTVVVDKVIKRRWAIFFHISFTIIGLFIGSYAALKTGYLRLAFFHFTASVLLWFYSTHFKKQLLIGNIVVSILTASVAFMPLVYEMGLMEKINPGFIINHRYEIFSALKIITLFSVFAFLTSLAREIIKDIEDYHGDKATGGLTMPIVWGIRSTKLVAFFLLIITSILLLFSVYNTIKAQRQLITVNNLYILLGLIFPLLFLAYYTLTAKHNFQFKRASLTLKLIMLMGLGYSLVFYYY